MAVRVGFSEPVHRRVHARTLRRDDGSPGGDRGYRRRPPSGSPPKSAPRRCRTSRRCSMKARRRVRHDAERPPRRAVWRARAGAHVFSEKPMATTLDGRERSPPRRREARDLPVGFNRRWAPATRCPRPDRPRGAPACDGAREDEPRELQNPPWVSTTSLTGDSCTSPRSTSSICAGTFSRHRRGDLPGRTTAYRNRTASRRSFDAQARSS